MLERLEKLKKKVGDNDKSDVVGLRRKLERLRVQNEVLQKV